MGDDLKHSVVYSLACADGCEVVVGAEFEGRIHVFSARGFQKERDFPATVNFGGKRMAVSSRHPLVFAGCYSRAGLGAYDFRSGEEVWRLKPLRQFQRVTADCHSPFVFVNCEQGPALVIEAESGRIADRLSRCNNVYCSAYGPVYLIEEGRGRYGLHGPIGVKHATIPAESFAILGVAFGPNHVAISESAASVRIYDLDLGVEIGRYAPAPGSHVLKLAWNEPMAQFVLVEWPYERGGDKVLKALDLTTGQACAIATLRQATDHTFVDRGTRVFSTEGDLLDLATGTHRRTIELPRAKARDSKKT